MSEAPKDAKGLFHAALEIQDAAERAAFLERSCNGDPALRQRVEDLLRAYGQPDGPLDKLAAALAPTVLGEPIREHVGTSIGPYKLMEQIGEGGFGLVFVAEQLQPIRRKVALKIIKPGMDTRDVIARFEAERQALALMDHPNIARVLDAGTTESGRPYFVMELVRGIPITDFCDQSQLTPRERLRLFVDVCNAVQHAHQKGIIHRDLKPSNVLVTLHDDRPVVKVIDFGVAKALHQSLTDRTVYTRLAQIIGTPLYMSPEQAQMSGLDIDTRSDVYSLGVLLYELLTGSTPFDKQRLARAAFDELLKILREEEPPKPSLRLSQSGDSLPSIAALRKTEPARLSRMFHGDLDWITMKALKKDRKRRYETANGFAADVLRYLNDEPVEASPPSASYRLRKFSRKHRGPVISLTAIAAVLVIGITGTTWGLVLARRAEKAADASKNEAISALQQVIRERDEKEAARKSEAVQRDQAERQFAEGLLRSIGLQRMGRNPTDSRTWPDWSAIKDSRLKLRVLEVALENPEVAMRVARRSESVVQACVGLSLTRRARALELLSAKQGDARVDPRIRIAACWLASELGARDIRAGSIPLNESLRTFKQTKSGSFLLEAFFKLAGQFDEAQRTNVRDSLIDSLGRSRGNLAVIQLTKLANHLSRAQLARVCDTLVVAIPTYGSDIYYEHSLFNQFIVAIEARLGPDQMHRIGAAVVDELHRSLEQFAESDFAVSLPRLQAEDISRAGSMMIESFDKSNRLAVRLKSLEILRNLLPRLDAALSERCAQVLETSLARLPKTNDETKRRLRLEILETLIAIGPKLESAHVAKLWDAIVAVLTESPDSDWISSQSVDLSHLAARLDEAQTKSIAEFIIRRLPTTPSAFNGILTGLAPRLDSDQAARAWDAVVWDTRDGRRRVETRNRSDSTTASLASLAKRLETSKVDRVVEMLAQALQSSRWGDYSQQYLEQMSLNDCRLTALRSADRLKPSHERRLATALITVLEKRRMFDVIITSSVVRQLAPGLLPAESQRVGDALLATLSTLRPNYVQPQIECELAELVWYLTQLGSY